MTTRRVGAWVLLLGFLFTESTLAQLPLSGPAAASAQPELPPDTYGRDTPRGTVRGFLTASGTRDDETARHYLNSPEHGKAAAVLAHQLFVVLNQRLKVRLSNVSDKPEGSLAFPAEPGKDLVGTISSDAGDVDIVLERVENKNSRPIWLFSRKTLAEIPELYAEVVPDTSQGGLLKFLVETRIAHIALLHWLVIFVGIPLFFLAGKVANRFASPLAGRLLRRLHKNPDLPDPHLFSGPVSLLLLAAIIWQGLSSVTLPLLARQFWSGIAAIAATSAVVWLMMRANRWFEGKIRLRLGRLNLTGALSMLRFLRSAVDASVIFVGFLILLRYFGINATTALAGLGLGGIAIALAAQKTLENVIAGISLISDKAIRVGDFLKLGDTLGTVTDIGLRSTRIRTLDRTIVNLPNGQIANASLENYSLRDRFWFHPTLRLSYETNVTQLRSILMEITGMLLRRPGVDSSSVRARLLQFGDSSLDIEIFAYVYAGDYADFLRIQEDLLLQVMELVGAAGARIAVPARKMYVEAPATKESHGEPASRTLIEEEITRKS